ncbi:MAG TPA: cell division protein FtsA [candidate division WOR-3 bacterium]|uniref:Cell division protein FtsA n=1 Tax=candidate division WOR-3 bacterium TaxID=2052148 RepID=A0A7V0XEB7_UNCW3|nr:cell division protein FtsA [candidate division WOR-3 bacterium]
MAKSIRTAAIDIGTTKVACVLAETDPSRKTSILGYGTAPPDGFRQGAVISLDKATESLAVAVAAAEEEAGVKVKTLPTFVGITGAHLKHLEGIGAVSVRRPDRGISARDVKDVVAQAQAIRLPSDEQILHVVPTQYIVDEQKGVRDPLGMFGVKLEVEVLMIIGALSAFENIDRALERLDIRSRLMVLSGLATSYAVSDENDRSMGYILVDLGGVTTVTVYREGEIRFHRMVEIGATNITRDVAIGLRTTFGEAERVKREAGVAMAAMLEKDEALTVEDASGRGTKQVSRRLLASVIEPRVEEILTLANSAVREARMGENLSGGIILTGGGAQLRGVDILAEQLFGMPVRLARPDRVTGPKAVTSDPSFATAVGLILSGLESKVAPPGRLTRLVDQVRGWF